jgi:hypothetical protein
MRTDPNDSAFCNRSIVCVDECCRGCGVGAGGGVGAASSGRRANVPELSCAASAACRSRSGAPVAAHIRWPAKH